MSSWNEWSKHVLIELERLDRAVKELDERLDKVILDNSKSDIQKTAEIEAIRKDVDGCKESIAGMSEALKIASDPTKLATLQGELGVWTKIWMAILSIMVFGLCAYALRTYMVQNSNKPVYMPAPTMSQPARPSPQKP